MNCLDVAETRIETVPLNNLHCIKRNACKYGNTSWLQFVFVYRFFMRAKYINNIAVQRETSAVVTTDDSMK